MAAWVAPQEQEDDVFSPIHELELDSRSWISRVCTIADYDARTDRSGGGQTPRPTMLAVSGEQQRHVSKFFRSWRAEQRGWQVLIPLWPAGRNQPYFFDEGGLEPLLELMQALVSSPGDGDFLPASVEGGRLHLVGTSNGGATVLAAACAAPHLVASLTLVTGFVPEFLRDLEPLRQIPLLRLYAGDQDELGHQHALTKLANNAAVMGIRAHLRILRGATHMSVGHYVNQAQFWDELEQARSCAANAAVHHNGAALGVRSLPGPQQVSPSNAPGVQAELRRRTIALPS